MRYWECNCRFVDPSQAGATIVAPVQGCAPHGLDDDVQDDIDQACSAVCAGQIEAVSKVSKEVKVGFATFPTDGCDADTLLGGARAASQAAEAGNVGSPRSLSTRVTISSASSRTARSRRNG